MRLFYTTLFFLFCTFTNTYAIDNSAIKYQVPQNYPNVKLYPNELSYYANGALKCGFALQNSYLELFSENLKIVPFTKVCFHRNQLIKSFYPIGSFQTSINDQLLFASYFEFDPRVLELDDQSRVLDISILNTYNFGDTNKAKGRIKFKIYYNKQLLYNAEKLEIEPINERNIQLNEVKDVFFLDETILGLKIVENGSRNIIKPNYGSDWLPIYGDIEFYGYFEPKYINLKGKHNYTVAGTKIPIAGTDQSGKKVYFHTKGRLKKAILAEDINIKFYKDTYQLSKGDWIEFAPSGQIVGANIHELVTFRYSEDYISNLDVTCKPGFIKRYPSGELHKCITQNGAIRFSSKTFSNSVSTPKNQMTEFNLQNRIIASNIGSETLKLRDYSNKVTGQFQLAQNENPIELNIKKTIQLRIQGKYVLFGRNGKSGSDVSNFKFYPEKYFALKEATIAEDMELNVIEGTRKFHAGERLCFNSEGLAASKFLGECNW